MARSDSRKAAASKPRTGQLAGHMAGKLRPNGRSISPILLKFKELYPEQTAIELALKTGADVRHCERCLAGTRDLGLDFTLSLLARVPGKQGFDLFVALMGQARPDWLVDVIRRQEIGQIERELRATKRRLEALEGE